ncbi:MAG: hypothetical protein J2P28_21275 [Actinobacteria bacterium]|nr:hypothetical protein [Candidatus Dormibacteraeota bacterium]MBO0838026.1 hypothetical protein [Actinomycetota bacterium]
MIRGLLVLFIFAALAWFVLSAALRPGGAVLKHPGEAFGAAAPLLALLAMVALILALRFRS